MISENELLIIRGKAMAGVATPIDVLSVFEVMDEIEARLLDEGDQNDAFGTEGWRHAIGWDD